MPARATGLVTAFRGQYRMQMAKQKMKDNGPVTVALTVLGIGVVAAVVVGLIYGLMIDNIPRGLGQGGAVVMFLAAIVGVAVTFRTDARRRQAGR